MEQPGFFDRLKTRFTQNAAGTTDLSNLTEEQQKLLRRQFIGRLGTSLAQTGDFGAGMEAQTKAAAEQRAAMQAEAQQRAARELWSGLNGAQATLAAPGGVAAPAPPQLLNPASANPQPGVPSAQTQASRPQAGAPAASQITPDMRTALAERITRAYAMGQPQVAEAMMKYAEQFAPREEWFAPTAARVGDREVLIQASKFGGERQLEAQPALTDTVRTMIQFGENPEAYQRRLAERAAGASRMTVNQPFERAFDSTLGAEQAKQLGQYQQQAIAAVETKQQLGELRNLLSGVQTGATPAALAEIGRFFGAENASTLEAVQSAAMPFVLARMQQLGGGDSNEEMRAIRNSLPNFGITPQANEIILGALERAAQRAVENYQQAEAFAQTPGNIGLRGFIPTVRPAGQSGGGAQAAPPASIPPFGTPEFDAWLRSQRGGQ